MNATISDFFGSNLEQEVLDEVVILPVAVRNNNTGTITLPPNHSWDDFESIDIGMGIASDTLVYCTTTIPAKYLKEFPSSWTYDLIFTDVAGTRWRVDINATSSTTATWSGTSSGAVTCWPRYIIGYKRRISRVGIDELMSAMSLPNLIANADLTSKPINQRGFNGDWSSLAVGAYGYDQWMKVSATHMGYVIEAGEYRPNAKHTLTKDDVVLGEFMSPASGHWIVAVPFATSGKFDLYAGQFKRPWHPVQDGLSRCLWFFQRRGASVEYLTSIYHDTSPFNSRGVIPLVAPVRKLVTPTVTAPQWYAAGSNSWVSAGVAVSLTMSSDDTIIINLSSASNGADYQCVIVKFGYAVDASITLAEVGGQITTIGNG